jgi:hypothetical protein
MFKNKYIKYKKKYYNLKYGGSKLYNRPAYNDIMEKYEQIKKIRREKVSWRSKTKYNFLPSINKEDAYYLHIWYEKGKLKLDIKINKDKNVINIPIIMTKEYIDFFDIFKIGKDIEKDYIEFRPILKKKMEEIKYNNLNTITYLPIIFKFTDSEKYTNSKTFKHTILYDQFLKYKQLKIEEIYRYYKNNIQFIKLKEETDIINDIFNMTDGRQYIYSKKLEEENKKEDIKKIFSSLVTNNEISKKLLNSIIYLDDGINYDDRYKQYLINYNAPDNLKNKFSKVFRERGEYFKKIKEGKYKLSKKIKPILKKIGFTDIDKIEELINNKLHNLIYNYDYKDNISSLFNINYNQCKGNVPLSDLELENKDTIINLFDNINNMKNDKYKVLNERFQILLNNTQYKYDNNSIKIYFELFGSEYNKSLKELKEIENKDLKYLINNKKELLQKLFNHNIIFFGLLNMLIPIINLIIIRKLYYLLYSIEWENFIPLLWWDLIINKYIFACRLNNMKRFFFIFKKEQNLNVKPENRAFNYDEKKHSFLNKITYNNKYLWVFLKKDTKELIFVDRTSSIVYLNNSSIPTNVLYTELKMLLWRKDFTDEDFRFFHINDNDTKHDTIFCINKKTLDKEYKLQNPITKINGIQVREVELRMDTDGRTIGFFNL